MLIVRREHNQGRSGALYLFRPAFLTVDEFNTNLVHYLGVCEAFP